MTAFCYERPGIPFRTYAAPRLAMDAAPDVSATTNASKPLIPDDLFKQILEALRDQIDEKSFGKVRDTLAPMTKMSMDQPPVQPRRVAPENVARAVALLRANDVDEDLIKQVCAAVGASVPEAQAMDAAIRSRSYADHFPDAARLSGNAALAFDRSTESSITYEKMFPETARLS
jgi:uncharacterized protein (DUF2267 family)